MYKAMDTTLRALVDGALAVAAVAAAAVAANTLLVVVLGESARVF